MREQILSVIIDYIKMHGYPPTVREIGDKVGLHSTSSVHHYLREMLEDGTLETDAEISGMSRAIRVPGYVFVKESER